MACGDSSSPEEAISEVLQSPPEIRATKISSEKDGLIVVLKKAPKIIAQLRGLAQNAVFVGFKLLSDTDETELLKAGHALLMKNDCDFVLANDLKTVRADGADRHEGLLIKKDGSYERATGKEAIAALIVKRTIEAF